MIAYIENKNMGPEEKQYCRTPFSAQLSWAPKVPQGQPSSPPLSWDSHGKSEQLHHGGTARANRGALVDPRLPSGLPALPP